MKGIVKVKDLTKKQLKREIKICQRLGKFPPRYYVMIFMLKSPKCFIEDIFNQEILNMEIPVEVEE